MNEKQLKARTKSLALRIIRLVGTFPNRPVLNVIGKQLLRSGTSVGANYRAACRARSTADMIGKLSIVEEEADESLYWMEILVDAKFVEERRVSELLTEMNEIVAIVVASIKTLRSKQIQNPKSKI